MARIHFQKSDCGGFIKESLREDYIDDNRCSLTPDMQRDPPVEHDSSEIGGTFRLPILSHIPQSAISDYYAPIIYCTNEGRALTSYTVNAKLSASSMISMTVRRALWRDKQWGFSREKTPREGFGPEMDSPARKQSEFIPGPSMRHFVSTYSLDDMDGGWS